MKKTFTCMLLFTFYISTAQLSSDIKLLADLQQKGQTQFVNNTAVANGKVFFRANNTVTGEELYATDGTSAGTNIVSDINLGPNSSFPTEITSLNNMVYFAASNGSLNGKELWKSDGVTTSIVKDINTGSVGSFPLKITAYGSEIYFQANSITHKGLYKSDGTAVGTVLIKEFATVADQTFISEIQGVGSTLFFSLYNFSTLLTELWKTDGTSAGTVLVKSFPSTSNFVSTSFNGNLYFNINGSPLNGLWKSDGTVLGTVFIANINANSFETLNGNLFLSRNSGIIKIDGNTGDVSSISSKPIRTFKKINASLFYLSTPSNPYVLELWKSDGVTETLIKSFPRVESESFSHELIGTPNGTIYFKGYSHVQGAELWKTDGTAAGTVLVKNIRDGLYSSLLEQFTALGNILVFFADDGHHGLEPYKSDGTAAGTTLLKDLKPNDINSFPANFTQLNNNLLFTADIDVFPSNLFITSSNFNTIDLPIHGVSNLISLGTKGYFSGVNSLTGAELHITDGTYSGTNLLKDIVPGAASSFPSNLTALGTEFLFTATDLSNNTELWLSNGTNAGTNPIAYTKFTSESSDPHSITVVDGNVAYFLANGGGSVEELWRTGGIAANTQRITIAGNSPIIEVGGNANMGVLNNEVYFSAADAAPNFELWKTDGVTATLVAELEKFANTGSSPHSFITVGQKMYFRANTPSTGIELWITDGTTAGTILVKDINPGVASADPQNMVALNGILYFSANDGINGIELWRTDGSSTGTYMLKNIHDTGDALPSSLTPLGNALYFAAEDGKHGRELWKTDGTLAGTVLVHDYNRDYNNGNLNYTDPLNLFNFNGTLYFSAQTPFVGYEPHYYRPCNSTSINIANNNTSQILPSQTLQIEQNIAATNTFLQGRSVNYFAGKSISLNPGFSVSAMAGNDNVFRAEIKGCY